MDAGKDAITLLPALDRWVLVDPQYRSDRKWLPDNSDIPALEHDDQSKRAPRFAPGLPERDRDRAVGRPCTGSAVAFGDPFVGLKLLPFGRPRNAGCLRAKCENEKYCAAISSIHPAASFSDLALLRIAELGGPGKRGDAARVAAMARRRPNRLRGRRFARLVNFSEILRSFFSSQIRII